MNIDVSCDIDHPDATKSEYAFGVALGDRDTGVHEIVYPDSGAVLNTNPRYVWTLFEADG